MTGIPKMVDSTIDGGGEEASRGRSQWMQPGILAAVCVLVVGVYAYTAHSGYVVPSGLKAADGYYNLLADGFRSGQLNLKVAAPPHLARLADPYDPRAHVGYPVLDMSYYKGKLYLYFGVAPAVLLFWPHVALTGRFLAQKDAAVIFCLVGFLSSAGLLHALWRRYFAEVNVVVVAAGALALGLVTCVPFLLARCDVYEVSVSCGYALTMLALGAVWKALHESRRRSGWLAGASLAYGLAVGARPSLLFGAIVLLVPVVVAWHERQRVWRPLIAAIGPVAVIACGLMLYNALRFDSPFEFGGHYQLGEERRLAQQFWSIRYLWFNFRVYFLEPARWSHRVPFVHDIRIPTMPAGHGRVEKPFGVLANIPLVWLALAVPLAWRKRSAEGRWTLCWFLAAVTVLFGVCALTLCLFFAACTRYEVEFLSALVLLAVVGVLSVERALATTSVSGRADPPVWRSAIRWGWSVLLVFSVAFNLLASVERCAEAHKNLGKTLLIAGKIPEAIGQYERALQLAPDYAEAHNGLGFALVTLGRAPEAIGQFEQALQLAPDYAEAHDGLGFALVTLGRAPEAIGHYEQALRLNPDDAQAHNNLGSSLFMAGKVPEAIGQYEQALQLRPDYADAHNNLGAALERAGRRQEAIEHYEQALRIEPDLVQAQTSLARARAAQ
jgi:Flp pilus assembly protein TadD